MHAVIHYILDYNLNHILDYNLKNVTLSKLVGNVLRKHVIQQLPSASVTASVYSRAHAICVEMSEHLKPLFSIEVQLVSIEISMEVYYIYILSPCGREA